MQVTGSKKKISVRVGLTAFCYKADGCAQSQWLGADRVFSRKQLQDADVEISVFSHKFALIPENFFREEEAGKMLSSAVVMAEDEKVEYCEVPDYGAVAVYSCSGIEKSPLMPQVADLPVRPELLCILEAMHRVEDYNKIIASVAEGRLYLAIAQGNTLLLATSYEIADFTTAEYHIFYALKKFQMNPELSTVYLRTPLSASEEMSLYNYFKSVELI